MKRLLISRDFHETRVATLEEGELSEFFLERPRQPSLVGNIYKGRVENVLAGLDAAFVDIGLQRNGYLYVEELAGFDSKSKRRRKISDMLRSGQEVLVQIAREGRGAKGPRLTMQLGLPGRYLVYLPGGSGCGVSRRLEEAERERLRGLGNALRPEQDGLIIRTAAAGADLEALSRDLRFLQRVWAGVARRIADTQAPALVYQEPELALRVVRDQLSPEFSEILVDDESLYRRLHNYVGAVAPDLRERLSLYQEKYPLLVQAGVEAQLRQALQRRVELPSGGYIVIDQTEAMTVVDVNTGRFVGKRLLEETILKTNLEACREIVRQLRLRDIGGIIVIDLIDMTLPVHREAVRATLEAELAKDRNKSYVVEISPLGLVEMTRQNVTLGLRQVMTSACPLCQGEGRLLSEESALAAVERQLAALAVEAATPGVRVEVHPRLLTLLHLGRPSPLERLKSSTGRFFLVEPAADTVPLDHVAQLP